MGISEGGNKETQLCVMQTQMCITKVHLCTHADVCVCQKVRGPC